MTQWYTQNAAEFIVNIYVQPGAKRNEVVGLHGDSLKIRLTTAPIEGRANQALLKYLATLFDVPLHQLSLKRGDKSRRKVVVITDSKIEPQELLPK